MLDADILRTRFEAAERYLELVDDGLYGSWHEAVQQALDCRSLVSALSLVHPQHWRDWKTDEEVLGPRRFKVSALPRIRHCAAIEYWGVECTLARRSGVTIHADHAWPYSLGGRTHVGNIRWLCQRHNAAKSSDVHLYPWEGPWPDWLGDELELLGQVIPRP